MATAEIVHNISVVYLGDQSSLGARQYHEQIVVKSWPRFANFRQHRHTVPDAKAIERQARPARYWGKLDTTRRDRVRFLARRYNYYFMDQKAEDQAPDDLRKVVKVLTGDTADQIIATGTSGAWKADGTRIARCEYLVCVRNSKVRFAPDDVPHGAAFLIGRISGVSASADGRVLIHISHYSRCNQEDVWRSDSQNPVRYLSKRLAESQLELDLDEIEFTEVSTPSPPPKAEIRSLTIPEAKAGLAMTLGIKPEQIEITINA